MSHVEVPIKVTAWVDEGVAPLVRALNEYPGVVTVDSCQCDSRDGKARVDFTTHDDGLGALVEHMAADLATMKDCPAVLSLGWWYGGEDPIACLRCPPTEAGRVAEHLTESVSGARMTPCPRDTSCTALHSSTTRRDRPRTGR